MIILDGSEPAQAEDSSSARKPSFSQRVSPLDAGPGSRMFQRVRACEPRRPWRRRLHSTRSNARFFFLPRLPPTDRGEPFGVPPIHRSGHRARPMMRDTGLVKHSFHSLPERSGLPERTGDRNQAGAEHLCTLPALRSMLVRRASSKQDTALPARNSIPGPDAGRKVALHA
jgi:hypothetical protein